MSLPAPLKHERMKPLVDRAQEGRANPKGIPYLYLATHQGIAVAEVRPWVGSHVTIARFELIREVRLINTVSSDQRYMTYSREPESEERERAVWLDIDRAFSQPVTSADDTADYAATQVLAEFFHDNGIDGIAYGSSLGEGHNVVLFDMGAAVVTEREVVQIRVVKFEYMGVVTVESS
jgi:RES domain-containing protein